MRAKLQKLFGKLLILILVLNGFVGLMPQHAPVAAQQNRVIIISAEQPNVWTLEQAHYLLAQMHRRNLDLKAKSLEDLDPNEINGLRFEVMRMLIEFGATFNQADLASNRLVSRNQEFNAGRRQQLVSERDSLRKESLKLTGEIADLETEKADAESEEDKQRIDAKIAARKTRRDRVDKEIEFLDGEIGTLTAPSGELRATEGGATFDPNRLPKSVFDKAFEEAAAQQIKDFNQSPRLNASLRLDNFLQMQYEIIAKQLTLLRDEVGPGERLLFLELPQTVNVTHNEANKKWAQSWWRILGYTKKPENLDSDDEDAAKSDSSDYVNRKPTPTSKKMEGIMSAINARGVVNNTEYVDLDANAKLAGKTLNDVTINNRLVRTIELIPRQSSLNVNDMKLDVRAGAFNFVLSTLFGFGSRLNIQRQREQFSQFVQQELYSSAFGKGAREFGWTFTPMPGTDRLLSGVRTTYAVLVVPEEATSLVLESNGCYFPRSAYPPNDFKDTKGERWQDPDRTSRNCGTTQAFVAPIPVGDEGRSDFWVRSVSYQPVGKGKRAVVLIAGSNFSSQIGVLVNGVPLPHSIGLAQPLIRDDSRAGAAAISDLRGEKVRGRIERIDANKIIFSVEVDDFEGTPTITLVAPGKAIDINWLKNISVNGKPARLADPGNHCKEDTDKDCERICSDKVKTDCQFIAADLFRGDPVRPLRIDSVEVFRSPERRVNVLITGAGFKDDQRVFVNGVEYRAFVSPTLLHAKDIPAPSDDKVQVTVAAGDKTIKSTAVINPAQLRIDKVTVVSYEPAKGKAAGVLVVKLDGSGFPENLELSNLPKGKKIKVDVTSSTEAFLTITNPDETEVLTLRDPLTKLSVSTVVARKPPKQ